MSKFNNKLVNNKVLFFLILVFAFFLRFYGINWDQGQHFHPDERFLTMVETGIKIPKSFGEYLNPKISPMSPYNSGSPFFVYGTFPLNLTKIVGLITGRQDYGTIHLVGRFLSSLFDLGVIYLLFRIGKKISDRKVGLLSAFLYAMMVFPIQLSHFFTVDTFLNFFIVLSFYLLVLLIIGHQPLTTAIALGTSFGFALACKISAIIFLPIILLGLLIFFLKKRGVGKLLLATLLLVFFAYFAFRLNQPTAFSSGNLLDPTPNPQFISNLKELKSYDDPQSWFPPALQWQKTVPFIFPLKNIVLWGVGLPLGIVSLVSIFSLVIIFMGILIFKRKKEKKVLLTTKALGLLLATVWILLLFLYQGIRFVKTMRYFIAIYPFLALLSAFLILWVFEFLESNIKSHLALRIIKLSFFVLISIYPLSFLSIYYHRHTRISASEWIFENIPPGSTISCEHWDDCLPVSLKEKNWEGYKYKIETLELYVPDVPEKWQKIDPQLERIDYLILSSNRLWGSIPRVPERYPKSSVFYQNLFKEKLNFKKIAEFSSYPCFPFFQPHLFCFNDDSAEEAFSVYDHPKVIIFKKND